MRFKSLTSIALALFCITMIPLEAKKNTADYVVIGVGTAGAVVTRKLSDDNSVIALHLGKNLAQDPLIKYTRNARFTVGSAVFAAPPDLSFLPPPLRAIYEEFLTLITPIVNQLYIGGNSIPQVFADDRELLWVVAKPEGGASSVNAGAWCRGTNQVYSQWEELAGPQWSTQRILAIYKELENYHGITPNRRDRGYCGPVDIRLVPPSRFSKVFTKAIIRGCEVPYVLDYNNLNTPIGASSRLQITERGKNGRLRVSSNTAFLGPDVVTECGFGKCGRKLRILYNSRALRTIWEGNKAVGVEFLQHGKTRRVYARKGIVVCAGLFSSPFLLHSGIGDSSLLGSLGIPVVFDNPNVGQGLADQPNVITLFLTNPNDTIDPHCLIGNIAWLTAPDERGSNIRKVRFATFPPFPGLTLALIDLVQPLSRGTVSINSANPLDPPVIDGGVLSNSDDLDLLQQAFQIYLKNINIQLSAIDPQYKLVYPDPAILDDPILTREFIEANINMTQHYQSHCRMAPLDQGGVVDGSGRVYGVENLYVADDSISPQDMDGSPMASAYLIGANVARIILDQDAE